MTDHETKLMQLIDAIKSIPPSPPKVREWVDRFDSRWRLMEGKIEFKVNGQVAWCESVHGSVEEMLANEKVYGIREITNTNTGEGK